MMPYNPVILAGMMKGAAEAQASAAKAVAEPEPVFTALYFGYASNLSWRTMKQRCPDSLYTGLGRLDGWKWVVNSSRFPNLVRSPGDVVYGSLAFLSARDEAALNVSEEVPWLMQKLYLPVTRLQGDGSAMRDAHTGQPQVSEALAYIDETRLETDGVLAPEFVVLMNKAITDGLACGMPATYADEYLRPYTPRPTNEEEEEVVTMVRTHKMFDIRSPQAPVRDDD